MKIRVLLSIAMLGLVLICADSAMAFTFNADGKLDASDEWGVNPSTPKWVPNSGIYYSPLIDPVYNTPEDTIGGGYQVYPGYGGQLFDAEALYLNWSDTTLYLALVTGFPNTTATGYNYSAGDIAIDFGANDTYEYGIEIGGHKTTGQYTGLNNDSLDGNKNAGHVYKGITWQPDTLWLGVSSPLYMITATDTVYEAGANFIYTLRYDNEGSDYDHYVVEMSIPRIAFGGDWNDYMRVHWTQSCGNDNVNVTTVPEPMSMALLGGGLLALLGSRLRRRKK